VENDDSAVNSIDSAKPPSVAGNGQGPRRGCGISCAKVQFMLNDSTHVPGEAILFSSTDAPASVGGTPKKGMTRMARSRVQRRNTMDCALLNEMFVNEEGKRTDKRLQSLLRDSEREMKNSLATSTLVPPRGNSFHETHRSAATVTATATEAALLLQVSVCVCVRVCVSVFL